MAQRYPTLPHTLTSVSRPRSKIVIRVSPRRTMLAI